jgi:hypothetical protein
MVVVAGEAGELAVVACDFEVAGEDELAAEAAAGDFADAGDVEVFGELCP